jgi:AraC-like DNA-binding protein/mannose-6-phosphate isomerase-like protein (cupin superfamily)
MTTHEIISTKPQLPVYFDIYQSNNLLVPSHWHAHLEVLYLYHGTMHIVRNDEKYIIHEKDLFVINSGDIHYTRNVGSAEVFLLQIPYEFLNGSIHQFNTIRFNEYYAYPNLKEDPAFLEMMELVLKMGELYRQKGEGYQFLFSSNLNLFLQILYTHYSIRQNPVEQNKEAKQLARLREIITYVEQHYMEPLSLTDAASLAALNPEYFCRSFKKYMGLSFLEYVNMVRLTHIHNDILGTGDSITDIQEKHGFSNYKVFNRMFKEVYGCTPSRLRSAGTVGNTVIS